MPIDNRIDKKRDTDTMCNSLMRIQYGSAPKMKISNTLFLENLKTAAYISMANMFIYMIEFTKAAIELDYSKEEILGQLQLELKESWDILATSKMGAGVFKKMELKDILESEHPAQLLRKSAVVRTGK
jgi:hypothetical protein